jgi:uncharacterized membrane protein YgaE (UPF0421/DUF939 family)
LNGAPFNPARLLPPVLWIALAFFLLKGSNLARIAIAVLSVISAAGSSLFTVVLALTPSGAAFSTILMLVSIGVISAGIAYLLLFSKDLKEEVLRRAKIKQLTDRLDRQKYYESLGAQHEE